MLLKCCNERKANYCILNTIYYILTISILFYTYCILGTKLKILRPGFNVPLQQNNCSQSCPPPMIIGREASLGLRLVGVSNTQPIKPFDTIIVIKGYFVQNE